MKRKLNKDNKIQLFLLIFGFLLIALTYFIYPKFLEKKDLNIVEETMIDPEITEDTSLTNVEYKGWTHDGSPYVIQSELAEIDLGNADLVHMKFIKATFSFKDGRIIVITSDEGQFNKFNGDMRFKKNVKMIDNEKNTLTSENLDMLVSRDYAAAYVDVKFSTIDGQSLITDKLFFDVVKKTFKISMFDYDEKVKLKLIK